MDRMKELVEKLNKYAHEYYVLDKPTVSDLDMEATCSNVATECTEPLEMEKSRKQALSWSLQVACSLSDTLILA